MDSIVGDLGPDETYVRALAECFNDDVDGPFVTPIPREGACLQAVAFGNAPEADYFSVFSAGLSALDPQPGKHKFELQLVMRDCRASWVKWFERLVAEVPLESCRPGAFFTRPCREDLEMVGALVGPPHRRVFYERKLLDSAGDHVRFLQLYPLFGVEELSFFERVGARKFLRSVWARSPAALFDPHRPRFTTC